jgi:hypothetical protein
MRRRFGLSAEPLKIHAILWIDQIARVVVEFPVGRNRFKKKRRLVTEAALRRQFRRSDYLVGTVEMV